MSWHHLSWTWKDLWVPDQIEYAEVTLYYFWNWVIKEFPHFTFSLRMFIFESFSHAIERKFRFTHGESTRAPMVPPDSPAEVPAGSQHQVLNSVLSHEVSQAPSLLRPSLDIVEQNKWSLLCSALITDPSESRSVTKWFHATKFVVVCYTAIDNWYISCDMVIWLFSFICWCNI